MPAPRSSLFDDLPPTKVEGKPATPPELGELTDPGTSPATVRSMPIARAVSEPSVPSVMTAPPGAPTVVEMPAAAAHLPVNTVEDMPAVPIDDDPTTRHRGIPKAVAAQQKAKAPPAPSRAPAPRVTASEVASVSGPKPRLRVSPLVAVGIGLTAIALVLLALSWLAPSPAPAADGAEPEPSLVKRMFDW